MTTREDKDPLLRALRDAPEDDESETEEERAEVEQAKAEIRRGEGRSWDEVRRELGRARIC